MSHCDHGCEPETNPAPVVGIPFDPAKGLAISTVGVDLQASGVESVTGYVMTGTITDPISPKAGRSAYLWLSGGTSASGHIVYSKDGGATWFARYIETVKLGVFDYQAADGNQLIPIYTPDQFGILIAVNFTDVVGPVDYEVTQ